MKSDVNCTKMVKTELLRNVDLFSKLGAGELDIVARHSAYYDYQEGEVIFEEGSVHDELYIIETGEVVVTKTIGDKKQLDVARYVAGECFGELAMLDNKPRTATASAARATTLLVFPERGVAFQDLLQRHPAVFAQILHKLLAIIAGRIRTTNAMISEESPLVEALRRQLLSDELTGLYNRTFLEEDFARLLPGYGDETGVLMVKPDNFKAINDTYGHEAGDTALKLLADTVSSLLEPGDLGVRYRGDEMTLILPGKSGTAALERAERLREAIASLDLSALGTGVKVELTASVGVALYPRDSSSAKELVEKAFATMWEARVSGGNRVLTAKAAAR